MSTLFNYGVTIALFSGFLYLYNKNLNNGRKLNNEFNNLNNEINNLKKENIELRNLKFYNNKLLKILSMQKFYNKFSQINDDISYKQYSVSDKLLLLNGPIYDTNYTYFYRPEFVNLLLNDNYEKVNFLMENGFDIFSEYKVPEYRPLIFRITAGFDHDPDNFDVELIDKLKPTFIIRDKQIMKYISDDMLEFILKKCNNDRLLNIKSKLESDKDISFKKDILIKFNLLSDE